MKPVNFAQANIVFKAPANWDEEKDGPCGDLYVHSNGVTLTSVWKPSPEELAELNSGGVVVLTIYASSQPVVGLGTSEIQPVPQQVEGQAEPEPQEVEEESASETVEDPHPEVDDRMDGAEALSEEEEHDTIPEVAEKNRRNAH